jgi:hypothetical protein
VEADLPDNFSDLSKNETFGSQVKSTNTGQEDGGIRKIYLPKSEIVNLDLGENEITHVGAKYLFEALA